MSYTNQHGQRFEIEGAFLPLTLTAVQALASASAFPIPEGQKGYISVSPEGEVTVSPQGWRGERPRHHLGRLAEPVIPAWPEGLSWGVVTCSQDQTWDVWSFGLKSEAHAWRRERAAALLASCEEG